MCHDPWRNVLLYIAYRSSPTCKNGARLIGAVRQQNRRLLQKHRNKPQEQIELFMNKVFDLHHQFSGVRACCVIDKVEM